MKKVIFIAVIITILGFTLNFKHSSVRVADTVEAAGASGPTFYVASSTAFTLTTASQRLLGTSTPTRRMAATIQPINCTSGGSGAFMRLQNDAAATTNTGLFAAASSTTLLGDHVNNIPVVQGAVQGITSGGTCTVLVTEWRTQF